MGTNLLTATATDGLGAPVTASSTVTATEAPAVPLLLRAVPASGAGPLTVTWQVTNQTGRRLVQFELDAHGTGTFNPPMTTFDGARNTYTTPGLRFPVLRATDDQGVQYVATTVVSIEPSQTVVARFQGLWDAFKGHLLAGNTSAALAQVGPSLQPRFEAVLQQLGADVGDVVAGFGTLQVLDQVGDLAEAVLIQADNGLTALHLIYFRRDSRGRWLIEGM